MRTLYAVIGAGLCLAAFARPAGAMAPPDCAGAVEIARARILRVERNGALVLSDGRAALLEGVRLPLDDTALAPVALAELRALAVGQALTLTAMPPKEDRYDRVRVQAFGAGWLQAQLLARGLAQVAIAPDRNECAAALYAAEAEARAAGRGLWALPAYGVRRPQQVGAADADRFRIVEGRVLEAGTHDGRVFLDFAADYRHGFSATIAPEDRKAFRRMRPALADLAGRRIRLRGIVQRYGDRSEIALSNPAQIEILD